MNTLFTFCAKISFCIIFKHLKQAFNIQNAYNDAN